jgi:imidazolonepropionase-like amidohydrolase
MPGLIDCHVHLTRSGAAPGAPLGDEDDGGGGSPCSHTRLALDAAVHAHQHVAAGVTTVRDCGSPGRVAIDLAELDHVGPLLLPRIVAAGRPITITGGHCHTFGVEVDGPVEALAAARRELKAGAAFIKAMATGGILTPGMEPWHVGLDLDELAAITQAAHNAGRRVTCHAIGTPGIKNAILAGSDSIEHGTYLDDETIQLALDAGTVLVPTLRSVLQVAGHDGLRLSRYVLDAAAREAENRLQSFRAAVEAGVRLATGTDAGTPNNPHGKVASEVAHMAKLGLPVLDALRAATSAAAGNLGLDGVTGTIAEGLDADLLLLDGDPTSDPAALDHVVAVWTRGRIHAGTSALTVGVSTP